MPLKFPFEDENQDKLIEGLAAKGKLSQDLYERYKQRRQEAIDQQTKLQSDGMPKLEDIAQNQRDFALVEGLSKAANKMGSIGGKVAQSDIGGTFDKLQQAEMMDYQNKSNALQGAMKAEEDATGAMLGLEDRSLKLEDRQRNIDWEDKTRPLDLQSKQVGLEGERLKLSSTQELNDPSSPVSVTAQQGLLSTLSVKASDLDAVGRPQEAQQLRATIQRLGRQPLSAVQVSAVASQFDIDVSKLLQAQTARQNRDLAVQASRDAKAEARAMKEVEQDRLLTVPGYTRDSRIQVRPQDAENMRKGIAMRDNLNRQLDEYATAIDQMGTGGVPVGEDRARLEAMARGIQLEMKELLNLGVLNGPDLALLEEQIPSPGFFQTESTMKAKIDEAKKTLNAKTETQLKARGYNPSKATPPAKAAPQEKIVNGTRYIKVEGGWEAVE